MIDFSVSKIASNVGKEFVKKNHYSHGIHNGPMCWGLFSDDELIGVIAFATPCSENVRASIFGPEHKDRVTELHRLVIVDGTPKNTESWFISRALKELKSYRPKIRAVVSFADATQGHVGTIYQATNAIYTGTSGKAKFYIDSTGRLRHPRQNGVNITSTMAKELGWTPTMRQGKYRYVFFIGDRKERKWSVSNFLLKSLPYPKL